MATYNVTLSYQHPANSIEAEYEMEAGSKRLAIARAQTLARNDGHYGYGAGIGRGHATWRAKEHENVA